MASTDDISSPSRLTSRLAALFLFLAAANCALQILWFSRFCGRNLSTDAISYTGIARHILDRQFSRSLNGYWSPLFSWLMVAFHALSTNFILLGHWLTLATLLACLPLLHLLCFRLWRSHLAAALAVFWFSLARGVLAASVCMIIADFLFAALVLAYFNFLLSCLRRDRSRDWLLLGAAHAAAFLAKAFAMPWLAVSTLLAITLHRRHAPAKLARAAIAALLLPVAIYTGWGQLLKTRYGSFTAGYQLRYNLLINYRRSLVGKGAIHDEPQLHFGGYDEYMVTDVPPEGRAFSLARKELVPVIVDAERFNLPRALKELVILLTPGGVLAIGLALMLLWPRRSQHPAETAFVVVALSSAAILIAAYCMLVFDGRYLLPVLPILLAIAALGPCPSPQQRRDMSPELRALWKTSVALTLLSVVFFIAYWSSPFRKIDGDFQSSSRAAAELLRREQPGGHSLIGIGTGPYPAEGVGGEANLYTAFFAGRQLIAISESLPPASALDQFVAAATSARPDAVVIWGSPADDAYSNLVAKLNAAPSATSARKLTDPAQGEVGTLILFSHR